MCLALIIAPVAVMIDLGGFSATVEQVRSVDPTHLNMLQGQTFIGVISLLAWGLGYFGQPHILVRFMAAKNASVMPRACKLRTPRPGSLHASSNAAASSSAPANAVPVL